MLKKIVKKNKHSNSGFSLIELILYIAIVGGLMVTVSSMFVSFSVIRSKAESQSELSQNARVALKKIRQETAKASSVNFPTAGNSANILNLIMSTSWTCFQVVDSGGINVLQMSEGGSGVCSVNWQDITSSKVSLDTTSYIFSNITNINTESTIQIKLKLNYDNRSEYFYSIQTTVSLK